MRQDELDLIQVSPAAEVLNGISPSMASVTQTVGPDDSGRVPTGGRHH